MEDLIKWIKGEYDKKGEFHSDFKVNLMAVFIQRLEIMVIPIYICTRNTNAVPKSEVLSCNFYTNKILKYVKKKHDK